MSLCEHPSTYFKTENGIIDFFIIYLNKIF